MRHLATSSRGVACYDRRRPRPATPNPTLVLVVSYPGTPRFRQWCARAADLDSRALARSARRLRRLVGAAAADLVSARRRSGAAVVGGVLRARAGLQLPALHGDDPSRLWTRDDRSRVSSCSRTTSPPALVAVGVAAHFQLGLLAWLFTAYVMWSPWHYAGQNFGLSMMFLRRAGVDVTPRERRWLHLAFVASYVMLLAAFNEGPSQDPLMLSLGLPVPCRGRSRLPPPRLRRRRRDDVPRAGRRAPAACRWCRR